MKTIQQLIQAIEADLALHDRLDKEEGLGIKEERKRGDMDIWKHNEEYVDNSDTEREYFDGYVEAYFHDCNFIGTYDEYLGFIEREKVEMDRRRK